MKSGKWDLQKGRLWETPRLNRTKPLARNFNQNSARVTCSKRWCLTSENEMLITPHNCDGHISMTKQNVAWKGWKVHKFGEVSKGLFTFFFFLHNIKKRKHSSSRSTRSWHKALINNLICVLQQVSTVRIASSSVDFSATELPISVLDTKGLVYSWSLKNIRVRCRCRTIAQFSSTLWPWRLNSKLLWFFFYKISLLRSQKFQENRMKVPFRVAGWKTRKHLGTRGQTGLVCAHRSTVPQ